MIHREVFIDKEFITEIFRQLDSFDVDEIIIDGVTYCRQELE